jgi:transmembrane sensor
MSDETPGGFEGMSYAALRRYVSGMSNAAEQSRIEAWAAESDKRRAYLTVLVRTWQAGRLNLPNAAQVETDIAWSALSARLDAQKPQRKFELPSGLSSVRHRRTVPGLAAAAVLVALTVGTMFWSAQRRSKTPVAADWREVVTQAAQRASVRLRDGTEVMLAPGSRLRYASNYGTQQRDVYLEGEAYFNVVHDSTRPFRVVTRSGIAEDIGTAFVVRNYPEQRGTEVVVSEGRVALRPGTVSAAHTPLILDAGELGRLDESGDAIIKHNVNVGHYLAWVRGELVFDGQPLRDVLFTLERWYDVDVELQASQYVASPIMATIRNEPVKDVLGRIALTLGLKLEQRDRTFILSRDPS